MGSDRVRQPTGISLILGVSQSGFLPPTNNCLMPRCLQVEGDGFRHCIGDSDSSCYSLGAEVGKAVDEHVQTQLISHTHVHPAASCGQMRSCAQSWRQVMLGRWTHQHLHQVPLVSMVLMSWKLAAKPSPGALESYSI